MNTQRSLFVMLINTKIKHGELGSVSVFLMMDNDQGLGRIHCQIQIHLFPDSQIRQISDCQIQNYSINTVCPIRISKR